MSDQKVEDQIASTGGAPGEISAVPVEASANEPVVPDKATAEQTASSEGGAPAPATAEAAQPAAPGKLEADKADKPVTKKASEVAGREKKSTPGGLFKKLLFWKKDKKNEEPLKKEEAKAST